jgi:hypothetical protein
MLVVRQKQREILAEPEFVERVLRHFQRYHLETVCMLPDDVLRKRIAHGIEKGRRYGLRWEYSLTVFVAHMIRINPAFDTHPAIYRELMSSSNAEDEKLEALVANVSEGEWDEAERIGDPEAYWRDIGAPTPPKREKS